MSVIQITKACTLKCDYCFDKENMDGYKEKKNVLMQDEVFFKWLSRTVEYYKNKPIEERSVCITWGEPTLHPNFKEYVNKSIISWMHVHLLSNFTFNDEIQWFLKKKMNSMSFLVNVNDPQGASFNWMNPFLWERTMKNLENLQSDKIQLSLNVWNPALSYDHIFDVLEKFPKLSKRVRVWIFNPIVTQLTETVFEWATWMKYRMLWKKIDQIVEKLYEKGYTVFMDCGWGHCVFSQKTLDLVYWDGEWNKCSLPIPEINIDTGYTTCFAMVDKFNEDRSVNINSHSITKYVSHMSLKTEFFKSHYLTLPKCQVCPKFDVCPKFCTSNNVYYWNRELPIDYLESLKQGDFENLSKEKKYSISEFMLAYWLHDKLRELLTNIGTSDNRLPIYNYLNDFLSNKVDKNSTIRSIESFDKQNKISDIRDRKLVNFAIITVQKY